MAREELRLHRASNRNRLKEVQGLYLELEEIEIEMDHNEVIEIEMMEAIRRAEIGRIDRIVDEKFSRLVRQEKSHWKIDSNRVNVIRRNRPRYKAIVNKVIIF